MKKKYNILHYVGLFIIFYQPAIININAMHIVGFGSLLYLVFSSKRNNYKLVIDNNTINLYKYLFLIFFYLLFVTVLINKGPLTNVTMPIYFMLDVIPFALALRDYSIKNDLNSKDLLDFFVNVGIIQAITSIAAFFIPNVQKMFILKMIEYGYSSSINNFSSFRIYGFSSFLTFGTPVLQSTLAVVCMFFKTRKKIIDYIKILVLLFSAIINARISIFILLIGFIAFLISKNISLNKKIIKSIFYVVVIFFSIWIGAIIIQTYSPSTYKWLEKGVEEIEVALGMKEADNYSYAKYFTKKETLRLPDDMAGILFGNGIQVMTGKNQYYMNSDIGYINDIWLGGVFYLILVYFMFFKMIIRLFNDNNHFISQIGLFLLLLFPIINIKGIVFTMFSLTNYLLIIYIHINANIKK